MKVPFTIGSILILLSPVILISCSQGGEGTAATYRNPVLHADYSDPDVVRAGDDFYMVASSFNCVPGLPVLHSTDLVNWRLIGYALERLQPEDYYSDVRHGGGVWAPCIRIHNGEFYIFYPDPDHGIFMVKSADPAGPWSEPVTVMEGRGLIDPSPLWDDDGKAYLAFAFAGSRTGVKSVLMVSRMNPDGTGVSGDPVMVFDGHDDNPTVEGPKFYKRNGWYYLFAPAGGVTRGWQLVLRSRSVFGPYEVRKVMHQGESDINGPHQGAWVTDRKGSDWFIHFQDKGAYGRIVHLQPVRWIDDWPVIGDDPDGDGTGEPVTEFRMPDGRRKQEQGMLQSSESQDDKETSLQAKDELYDSIRVLQASDEFNADKRGLQWQWQANPSVTWGYPSKAYGCYRLNCISRPDSIVNLWMVPSLFLQKLPAEEFTATARMSCTLRHEGEEAGMIVMGRDYQYISMKRTDGRLLLRVVRCVDADRGQPEEVLFSEEADSDTLFFGVKVTAGARSVFSYSTDDKTYKEVGEPFAAREGVWTGAKIGFFALRDGATNDSGYTDLDWFRVKTGD
ncbi:MAG: glycoside hydrolase 43 family protein [Bacteroidales bacterium]|jgi:beta-xylosidase|nr:glycoside hydrolase 43 family protein [Bacteroidales bacterium]